MNSKKFLSPEEIKKYAKDIEPFKAGFDLINDHVIISDPDGFILYANKGVEKQTGFSAEEILGRNPGDMWGGNMPREFYEKMWDTIKNKKQPFAGEVLNKRKDGVETWQEIRISPVLDEQGDVKFFIGIEPNITARKKQEQEQQEKFREELISILGHQLRNPLTSILWSLELLIKEGGKQNEVLEEIRKRGKDMSALINDLLILSRVETTARLEKENFDLVAETEAVIEKTKKQFPGISFSFQKEDGRFEIFANKTLATQVFSNIIVNAAEYSDKTAGIVKISLNEDADGYLFSCGDNGIGIPKDEQPKIFSRFFRASNANYAKEGGTGLGLFIVKMIVDNFGWQISFESEVAKGTTFCVKIPAKKAS